MRVVLTVICFMVGVWLFAFMLVNLVLGCETWDESYWDEYNSCITPSQFISDLIN